MNLKLHKHRPMHRLFAIFIGISSHCLFALGVLSMMYGIYVGLTNGIGSLKGYSALDADLLLILQFPLFHSWLLTKPGKKFLRSLSPQEIADDMTTTWFAFIAAFQIFILFTLWSPSHVFLFRFTGISNVLCLILYACSWLFLFQAMLDADISLQTGLKGWIAVARNRRPTYQDFPQQRTFSLCRQPIYLAFALILWTAPVWTLDRLAFASIWTLYCLIGPHFKERRYVRHFGSRYEQYQAKVPYFVPVRLDGKKSLSDR